MPANLFSPDLATTPVRRRVSLLPLSIGVHVVVIAAVIIVPLFADADLPEPARPAGLAYVDVALPPPPPPPSPAPPRPAGPQPSVSPNKAPLEAPAEIVAEKPTQSTGSTEEVTGGVPWGVPGGIALDLPPQEFVPPPPPQPKTVRPGGDIQVPRKVHDVRPVYPSFAQQVRREGTVVIEALIGEDGRIRQARVLQSVPLLDEAALAAVRQWVFTPTLLNGQPVSVAMTVTVDFRLR